MQICSLLYINHVRNILIDCMQAHFSGHGNVCVFVCACVSVHLCMCMDSVHVVACNNDIVWIYLHKYELSLRSTIFKKLQREVQK